MRFNVNNLDFAPGSPDAAPIALSTANKTLLSLLAKTANLRRGKIVECAVGPLSNPVATDTNIIWRINRQNTDAGTWGSLVPAAYAEAIESTAPVAGTQCKVNYSAEPGLVAGAILWAKALNQHSGFIWYAPDEIGLPWPALDGNGLACQARGATADYTGTGFFEAKFEE